MPRLYLDTCIAWHTNYLRHDETFADGFYDTLSPKFRRLQSEKPLLVDDLVSLRYLLDKDDEFALKFIFDKALLIKEFGGPGSRTATMQEFLSHFRKTQRRFSEWIKLPPPVNNARLSWLKDQLLNILPPSKGKMKDILLLLDCRKRRCHAFVTTDYRTIIGDDKTIPTIPRLRDSVERLGIIVRRPSELVGRLGEFRTEALRPMA